MASCDVVLSPLEGTEGEVFKSDIKFLEAARCGAVMIASPCVYEDTIQSGVNGFIARDLEDWPKSLSRLATDPSLLNAVAETSWRQVGAERMMSGQVASRTAWYRSLYARRTDLDHALTARWDVVQEQET